MQISSAVSRILAVLIVIVVILAAFGGYSLGNSAHSPRYGVITLTEYVETSVLINSPVVISGTCTSNGGTITVLSVTTVSYIKPVNATGYNAVTITTVHAYTASTTSPTITLSTSNNTSSTSTGCPGYG